MSMFIDIVRGILGLGAAAQKDDFATLDPDDVVGFWRADHDIDQAERAGDIKVAWARYGVRSEEHWDRVKASFYRRHGHTPEYSLAASTANFQAQLEDLAARSNDTAYTMPAEYLQPVEGLSLDRLAIAKVRAEVQGPAALAELGLDADRLARANAGWSARIGGPDPIAGAMLGGLYHTYETQVRAVLAR